jgi:hypothetical protein
MNAADRAWKKLEEELPAQAFVDGKYSPNAHQQFLIAQSRIKLDRDLDRVCELVEELRKKDDPQSQLLALMAEYMFNAGGS